MSIDHFSPVFETRIPGCLWIYRFISAGVLVEGSIDDLVRLQDGDEDFVWLHLDRVDRRIVDLLASIPALTEEARESLGGNADHQFVELADDVISGALVDHQYGIDGPNEESEYLRFACGPGFLITSRRTPLYSAHMTRRALVDGARVANPAELFEMLVGNLCNCTARMLREIAETLDKIEDSVVIEGRGRDQRASLGKARRKVVRLARQITGLQSTMQRLEEAIEEVDQHVLAEFATSLGQRAESLARDVANLQDRARMLQDEINAILMLETNDRLYSLTMITALLLPATFVTGYFGMNTKQLLFFESDNGTLYATLLCVTAPLVALLFMRRLGLASSANDSSSPASPKAVRA